MKPVTTKRVAGRVDAAKAKLACPCGWHFPFVKVTGENMAQVKDLKLHVQCPDCGKDFETDRTHPVQEKPATLVQ
jgi:hypothetical protein